MVHLVFYLLKRMNTNAHQSHPRERKWVYFILQSVSYSYKSFLGFFFPVMFISDNESFNPSLWEEQRKQRAQVAFECDEDKDEREAPPRVSTEFIFAYLVFPSLLFPPLISAFSLLWPWVSLCWINQVISY